MSAQSLGGSREKKLMRNPSPESPKQLYYYLQQLGSSKPLQQRPLKKEVQGSEGEDYWRKERMICGIPELHCTCASVSEVELNELSGWEGRPVSAGELSHHNRIFSGTTVGNAVLGRQNSNVQLKHFPFNGPFLKSDSKHSLRSYGAAYEIPDIPFKMEEVHKRRYKAKDNSSAHIRHYLSSYTYPNLENLIAQSLLTDGGTKSQFSSSQMVKPSLVVLQEPEKGNKNKYFPKPFDHISQGSIPKLLLEPSAGSRASTPFPATKVTSQDKISTIIKPIQKDTPPPSLTMCPSSTPTPKHIHHMGMKWFPSNFTSISVPPTSSDGTQRPSANKSANKSSSIPSTSSSGKSSSSQNKKQSLQSLKQKNKSTKTNTNIASPLRVSAQPRISFRASKIHEMTQDTMTIKSELKLPEVQSRCGTSLDHASERAGSNQHSWS